MDQERRFFLKLLAQMGAGTLVTSAALNAKELTDGLACQAFKRGGISLNYDNSQFFMSQPPDQLDEAGIHQLVDQFVGTQVDSLFFCVNSQRSSVASNTRQSVWDGYDPHAGDDQPFLSAIPNSHFAHLPDGPTERQLYRKWVHATHLLNHRGLDPYTLWLARCRRNGIQGWLSVRMNDVHNVHNLQHPSHDRFWVDHPEYRRDPSDGYNGQCLDYGVPEVREYQMAYVREMISRYDMDGFELDWMRNPFHLKLGSEAAGKAVITEFISEVRRHLDDRQQQLGRPIQLSVRVPDRPETAEGLGYDVPAWIRKGLIDRLVVTPFLFFQEEIPIERWKAMTADSDVIVEAGIMETIQPWRDGVWISLDPAAARAFSASLLSRGADRIYLFNVFPDLRTNRPYKEMLQQIGASETIGPHSRRHIVTNYDTWAPNETRSNKLPRELAPKSRTAFRVSTGPKPVSGQITEVRLACIESSEAKRDVGKLGVQVNGQVCRPLSPLPTPSEAGLPTNAFEVPADAIKNGTAKIELENPFDSALSLSWIEIHIGERSRN